MTQSFETGWQYDTTHETWRPGTTQNVHTDRFAALEARARSLETRLAQAELVTNFFYSITISNGTATSLTDFMTHNSITSLPYAYNMIVTAFVNSGFQSATNYLSLQVRDGGGTNINYKTTVLGTDWVVYHTPSGSPRNLSPIMGVKSYAAGATCGFRLAYFVDTGNMWADVTAHVRLVRS